MSMVKEIERVLLIHEPYISLIEKGIKTLEIRKPHTNIRGLIGISEPSSGKISVIVNLTGSIEIPPEQMKDQKYCNMHRIDYNKNIFDPYQYHFGWVLENDEPCDEKFTQKKGAVIWVKV